MRRYHPLSEQEAFIITKKGTEPSGSGIFNHHKHVGIYVCRQCDAPLFLSDNKFEAHCGWPSFDDCLPNAVIKQIDRDMQRTEILCQQCRAHLGHVFYGERLTQRNVRHCVNSISLAFVPAFNENGYERALCAGGCFWGIEYLIKTMQGVISTTVGYTGGQVVNPNYQEVCTGKTGHLEAVEIIFDRKIITYETLMKYFFEIHDVSQPNGQGPDIGPQYHSAVFYISIEQYNIAVKLKSVLETKNIDVHTVILPGGPFYPAEEYHQDYYQKVARQPYCHQWKRKF